MNKKLIFVGGNVRSGSTLLNLYLGNKDNSLALGEIYGLFQPLKKAHTNLITQLSDDDERWKRIIEGGKAKAFKNILKEFPEVDVLVDSSKTPFWVEYQTKTNIRSFEIQHVLIHKPLEDLAMSFSKRGSLNSLAKVYVNYHLKWFALFPNSLVVPYKNFVMDIEARENLCGKLGLDFDMQRENVYQKDHYNFFGSDSFLKNKMKDEKFEFRYRAAEEKEFIDISAKLRSEHEMLRKVEHMLRARSIFSEDRINAEPHDISLSAMQLAAFRLRDKMQKRFGI